MHNKHHGKKWGVPSFVKPFVTDFDMLYVVFEVLVPTANAMQAKLNLEKLCLSPFLYKAADPF